MLIKLDVRYIFAEGELDENSTTKDFLVVRQKDSQQVKHNFRHCNLIGQYLASILLKQELSEDSVLKNFLTTAEDSSVVQSGAS